MLTFYEATQKIWAESKCFGVENVTLDASLGKILAQDIFADRAYPPFNRAAMDGFAIKYADWENKIRRYEVLTCIFAGQKNQQSIQAGQCYQIMTGAATPLDADCIIRVEDAIIDQGFVSFPTDLKAIPFQNIAQKGEDISSDMLVFSKGLAITPTLMGSLAALGIHHLNIQKLPKVGIISTGNEVVRVDAQANDVQIRDSNSYTLAAFLSKYQISINYRNLVPDQKDLLRKAILEGLQQEILFISGGVSAGDADFIPQILKECGVREIFHKVQIKPGKPLWFGKNEETQTIVFALPGNPVSVQVAFKVFIEPFLRKCLGLVQISNFKLPILTEKVKKVKFDEFFLAKLQNQPNLSVLPLQFNGSGDMIAPSFSDGIVWHPASKDKLFQNEVVDFIAW
jgi:molybdopterin molybdotransferase